MGSLRNPIGPLPSSIYWRRRAVALGLLGLTVLVVLWMVTLGGDDGSGSEQGKGSPGKGPADSTITPGPTPSGPHISQRPGGRGDSSTGTGGSSGTGGAGGDHAGGGTGGSGTGGSGVLGSGDGRTVPAGSSVPDCASGTVRLTVRSVKEAYGPDEKPKFEIVVKNAGSGACKVNFGAPAAFMKITSGSDHIWSSDDCARGAGALLVELPGSGETKRTVEWDRKRTAPQCATPAGDAVAGSGTYRVEVKVAGVTERLEFKLEKA